MRRRLDVVLLLMVTLVVLVVLPPRGALAQSPGNPSAALSTRLPATIDGGPVEVVFAEDMQTSLDEIFPGETHPEIDALQAALADLGRSLADVNTVTAYFGPDGAGVIQGFGIPGGDAAGLQDALIDVAFIGFPEQERTSRDVGDHTVTMLSNGPLEDGGYATAVLPDGDALWMVSAEEFRLLPALEALLAVAAGTAPGNTGTVSAPTPQPAIGPATWSGTIRQTVTWNQGVYKGEATATFQGTLERFEGEGISYCESPCAAYFPHGEVAWTFEGAGPKCHNRQSGSLSTGDVVAPSDQILIMEPAGPDHLRYWGSGLVKVPPQDCTNPESGGSAGNFLDIPPYEGAPFADEVPTLRPRCEAASWRIEVEATELKGTCWRYDERAYEERFEWDLKDVDPR